MKLSLNPRSQSFVPKHSAAAPLPRERDLGSSAHSIAGASSDVRELQRAEQEPATAAADALDESGAVDEPATAAADVLDESGTNAPPFVSPMDLCVAAMELASQQFPDVVALLQQDAEVGLEGHTTADLHMVRRDGSRLADVPLRRLTLPLCLEAVRQNGDALRHVPVKLRTPKVCYTALLNPPLEIAASLIGWATRVVEQMAMHSFDERIAIALVEQDGLLVRCIPEAVLTDAICKEAVEQNIAAVRVIPRLSAAVAKAAIRKNANVLADIDLSQFPDDVADDLCLFAVSRYPSALRHVPAALQSEEVVLTALAKESAKYEHARVNEGLRGAVETFMMYRHLERDFLGVDDEDDDDDFFFHGDDDDVALLEMMMLTHDRPKARRFNVIRFVSPAQRTPAVLHAAMRFNGSAVRFLSAAEQTEEVCRTACKADPDALQYVHPRAQTPELVAPLLWKDGLLLRHLHMPRRTPELCQIAALNTPDALEYVPVQLQTLALCTQAIQSQHKTVISKALTVIAKENCTLELCLHAVAHNGRYLSTVPQEFVAACCQPAVKNTFEALNYVPAAILSSQPAGEELCLAAIAQSAEAIRLIPSELHSRWVMMATVRRDPHYLRYVEQSPQLCLAAVRREGTVLRLVQKSKQTPEVAETAVLQAGGCVLKHVDRRLLNVTILGLVLAWDAGRADEATRGTAAAAEGLI